MLTIEQVIATAIGEPKILAALAEGLTSDLVVPNPLLRRIAGFAVEHRGRTGKVPGATDWELWLDSLGDGERDGIREVLQRLSTPNPEDYDPAFFAERVRSVLRAAAARTARARLNSMSEVTPEALAELSAAVDAVSIARSSREEEGEEWASLGDLLRDPEIARPPEELIPGLAWRGRHTLLAGLPKLGKSTLIGEGAAALTRGGLFLLRRTLCREAGGGRVWWYGPDEHAGETARRFAAYDPDPELIRIVRTPGRDPAAQVRRLLKEWPADLLVVDSLIEWARLTAGRAPEEGDASGWAGVIRPLTALAHEGGVAVVTLHHGRKSDGGYRSSGEIAAGVDVMVEMLPPRRSANDQSVRHFRSRGRWVVEDWEARMGEDGRYLLLGIGDGDEAEPESELKDRILDLLRTRPGLTRKRIAGELGVQQLRVTDAVREMVDAEVVEDRGKFEGLHLPEEGGRRDGLLAL